MLSKDDAAKRLGMAAHEVVSVDAVDGGHVVVTHDGYPTLITDEGELVFGADAIGERLAPAVEDPALDGPDDEDPNVVPDGSAEVVLAWVTGERESVPERARRIIERERAKEKPRSGLMASLEKLVAAE